jgi:uncharacterized protein (DUF362 family)
MQANRRAPSDTVVASATVQRTPRVGIVLSSYKGGTDDYGKAKFEGLAEPRPTGEQLTDAQLRSMTRRAIDFGNHPTGGLRRIVGRGEAVVLLVNRNTEPVVVAAVIELLNEDAPGSRITVISDAAKTFGGAQSIDVSSADSMRMPAPGIWSRRDVNYRIPKALLECDKLVSIAPLSIANGRPSLALDNYRMLASPNRAELGSPDIVAMDLFGFHPAEYAVLGGTQVFRSGQKTRHNLVLAGPVPSAVDMVGSLILGMKPEQIGVLQMAGKRGFGEPNLNLVWRLGNDIKDARIAS